MPFCTPVRARVAGMDRLAREEGSSPKRLRIYGHWVNALNMQRSITMLGTAGPRRTSRGWEKCESVASPS